MLEELTFVVVSVTLVYLSVTGFFLIRRRRFFPVSGRLPLFVLLSIFFDILWAGLFAIEIAVGFDELMGICHEITLVEILLQSVIIQIYMIRCWALFFRIKIAASIRKGNLLASWFQKHRWLISPKVLWIWFTCNVVFTMVVSAAVLLSLPGCFTNMEIIMVLVQLWPAYILSVAVCVKKSTSSFAVSDAYGLANEMKVIVGNALVTLIMAFITSLNNQSRIIIPLFECWVIFVNTLFAALLPVITSYQLEQMTKETEVNLNNFNHVINVEEGHSAFLQFLRTEFSAEHLIFLDEVKRFKEEGFGPDIQHSQKSVLGASSHGASTHAVSTHDHELPIEHLFIHARTLLQNFVLFNSPYEINVGSVARQEVVQRFEAWENPDFHTMDRLALISIFDNLVHDVTYLLKSDSWPRFIKSEIYQRFREMQTQPEAMSIAKNPKSREVSFDSPLSRQTSNVGSQHSPLASSQHSFDSPIENERFPSLNVHTVTEEILTDQ